MPHDRNGKELNPGDRVFGKLYNTKGPVAGTLVHINPSAETCNVRVAFVDLQKAEEVYDSAIVMKVHAGKGEVTYPGFLQVKQDYGEAGQLEKVEAIE